MLLQNRALPKVSNMTSRDSRRSFQKLWNTHPQYSTTNGDCCFFSSFRSSLSSGGGYSISRVEHHSYLYTMEGRYVITKSSITWWITEKKYQPSKLSSPEINVWQCLRVYIDKFATICYTFTWLQAKLNTNILQETVEEENSSNFYRPSKSISC